MADEPQYSSDGTPSKRKYEDQTTPPSAAARRPTGFSAPDPAVAPTSYNSVPPPADEFQDFQAAKRRAEQIAARLCNSVSAEAKRPRVENGSGGFDSADKGFSSPPSDLKSIPAPSAIPVSYGGYQSMGTSKKIEIPNIRVGVIIGKSGETIKYLQLQSGAKIQVTRDTEADLNSPTRSVELMGTPEQIAKAEQLINDVLAEAESGGSGIVARRLTGQAGSDHFAMKIPNNKVGLVIGKGGETIKNMQARTGARIQVIPLHLPPGDTSTERTVQIDGTSEQIESAKQLVNEVISEVNLVVCWFAAFGLFTSAWHSESYCPLGLVYFGLFGHTNMDHLVLVFPQRCSERGWASAGVYSITPSTSTNRIRNPAMAGGYSQQGYQARPPTSWGTPGAPSMQQPGYGYVQPGAYPGQTPQYNMSQPPYGGYPSQPTPGGYPGNWDQTPTQQTSQGSGYDYYSQQPSSQQPQAPGGSAAPADSTGYSYSQPPASGYNQQGQGYAQDSYGGYHAPQSGYGQAAPYDQQQGYNSAAGYGNVNNTSQEGHTPSYGAQGDSTQAPPPVQSSAAMGQQGYGTGQQPSPNTASYPPQGATQPSYGVPPTSQSGYGSQVPPQSGYAGYGMPQAQKPLANPPAYGQTQQSPGSAGGYGQPGYSHSQPPPSSYAQPDSGSQRAPPSNYGAATQPGYGSAAYGAPPGGSQAGYGQGPPSYYGGGYSQPVYTADGNAAPAAQPVQQGGVTKSPQS
ncbi:F17H15.1/F17H15.1 [Citrus sinensis]|nr:F17H15.1/F17H15.1 [Citrus sinensis]